MKLKTSEPYNIFLGWKWQGPLKDYLFHKENMIWICSMKPKWWVLNPTDIPIGPNHILGASIEGVPMEKKRYQILVGKLIYLSYIRPDIAFALSLVQLMH